MQHADQVAGAVHKAIVPLHPLHRDNGGLAVAEQQQRRQVHATRRAAIDEDDALVADDLHPVVVGVVKRVQHQVGRVGKVHHPVAARGLKLKHEHGRGVHVFGGHNAASVNPGNDALHWAHQVIGQGEDVVAVVKDQRPAAAALLVEAPHPGTERHFPASGALACADVQADHLRLADFAGLDHLPGAHVRRVEDEILVDTQHDAGLLRGGDHAVGLGYGEGHGLLHRDVLASLAGGDGHRCVQVMRDEQLHQVNGGIGQELAIVGVDFAHAPGFSLVPGAALVGIAHSHDTGVLAPTIAQLVQVRDTAAADNSDANRGHGILLVDNDKVATAARHCLRQARI